MMPASHAAIGCSTLVVTAAILVLCSSDIVVAADSSKQVTKQGKRPTDRPVRTTDEAKQPTQTVFSTSNRDILQNVLVSLSSELPQSKTLAKNELEALQNFYGEGGRKPLWVNPQGLNKNARDIVAEFRSAGDYGLRPTDYKVPHDNSVSPTPESLSKVELRLSIAALIYARHATGGRVAPNQVGLQLTDTPEIMDPWQFLNRLSSTADPSAYLRSLHPRHSQFVQLRKKLLAMRNGRTAKTGPEIPNGPVLKRGISHAHVVLLRKRLGTASASEDRSSDDAKAYDAALEKSVRAFQRKNGLVGDGVVGAQTRRVLNGRTPDRLITKVLINMERWRWLPDDLGGKANIYVWANIPEQHVRVVQGNETIFSEKAIVGQVSHKTPVFSDEMEWIELHPTWFVPASIKVNDILPSLRRPTSTVMKRYNLRVNCGRYGTDPKAIDWRSIDIRQCSFTQPPGKSSVLGDFKFKFPNRHSVYMHDTHSRGLFNQSKRTFSHGCIRVQRPRRMAEILLKHDNGMTSERIGEILAGPKNLHKATLKRPIPVHITYLTVLFDDKGAFTSLPDYYGHDGRLARIVTGKSYVVAKTKARSRKKRASKKQASWWDGLFLSN